MIDKELAGKLIEFTKANLIERSYPDDELFEAKRDELERLCNAYAEDPLNPDFIEKGVGLVDDFDGIAFKRASETTYGRAKVNAVVTASRVRRTHFAAFLAGKYANDPNVGMKCKCWIFNAAAFSALQLRQAIVEGVEFIEHGNHARAMLASFADSATEEAEMYLSRAHDFDKSSVLTAFNRACMDVMSGKPERIRLGIEHLKAIPQPNSDCHAAEMSWHIDNYLSLDGDKLGIKSTLQIEDGNAVAVIEEILRNNSDKAKSIKDKRADLWEKEHKTNKALVAAVVVGSVLVGSLFVTPDAQAAMQSIVQSAGDILAFNMMGDGGIAALEYTENLGIQLARASFGDGGIA
jgi:hypothetical protein